MQRDGFKKRRRLRTKEVSDLFQRLQRSLGSVPFALDDHVDRAEGKDFDILYVGGDILVIIVDEEPFPTIRGLLKKPAERKYVTVDMGAVPYLYNGADVMAPGITEADPDISEGDLVWVRDERNFRPLVVGRALVSGEQMVASRKGKAVKTIHYVGDSLWKLGES